MFNPNDMRNIWPSIQLRPLIPQIQQLNELNAIQIGLYNNNQTLNHSNFSQQMPINSSVLLSNQQNVNQLMPYYNQNQAFAQQLTPLTPFVNNYNCFGPTLPQPLTQTNSSSFGFQNHLQTETQFISQPNSGLTANPLQSYQSMTQKTIQALVSAQKQINSNQNMNNTNIEKPNDKNGLNLLNRSQKSVLEVLTKEQEEFELQFKNWEKEFNNWKEANRSHPDKNAYYSYVIQWQEWRQKLVSRQQQMKELHSRTMGQLLGHIHQQSHQTSHPIDTHTAPPLPLTEPSQVPPPPPPPPPQTVSSGPSLPTPPHLQESQLSSRHANPSTLFSTNENIEKNKNINKLIDNQSQKSKSEIDKNGFIASDVVDKSDSKESFQSNVSSCETPQNSGVSESKSDSTVLSKAAETILFIQKQQELLKTLDSFKKDNEFSGDLEIIEGPKPFDMNDIVTKMKAIRPPENANESNQILSQLPSLESIALNQNSTHSMKNNYDVKRDQHISSSDHSFQRPLQQNFQKYHNNYINPNPNPNSGNDYEMRRIRPHQLPFDSNANLFQRPQMHNSNNHQFMPLNAAVNNQWMDSRHNIPHER